MKSNLTKWFRTVEIFVRKFFGSMMQVHSEDVVDGWTSSWSLYRPGGAPISIGHDKLVVEFPVSGARESWFSCFQFQDIPGKGSFYIFIPTAWSSIHGSGTLLWWFALSKHRVFGQLHIWCTLWFPSFQYSTFMYSIYPKNQLGIEASEDVCVLSCGFEIQSLDKEYVYITCTDDAAMASGCGAPPVNFTDLGGWSNPVKQLKIEAKWIPKLKLLYWSTWPRGISQGIPFGWWNFECLWVHTPHLHRRSDGWLPRDSCARHHWTSLLGAEV